MKTSPYPLLRGEGKGIVQKYPAPTGGESKRFEYRLRIFRMPLIRLLQLGKEG
jgi:hypothetical protein